VFNAFGLSQQYPQHPSFEPDKFVPSMLLADSLPISIKVYNTQGTNLSHGVSEPPLYPFQNMTIYHLMTWMHSRSHQKLQAEVSHLVKEVMQADDFNLKDLDRFSVRRSLHAEGSTIQLVRLNNVGSDCLVTMSKDSI
jgi:hypothetical protein